MISKSITDIRVRKAKLFAYMRNTELIIYLFRVSLSGYKSDCSNLNFQIDEAVYHDQLVMLEKLYNAFTKVDLAAGNQVRDGSYYLFAVSITKYVILFVIQNTSSSPIGFNPLANSS